MASTAAGYFGETFDRPFGEALPWLDDDAEPNAEMWATADESREDIVGLYHRVWAHTDATIDALDLDAHGHVAWWRPGNDVTLHRIMVHTLAEISSPCGPRRHRAGAHRPGRRLARAGRQHGAGRAGLVGGVPRAAGGRRSRAGEAA